MQAALTRSNEILNEHNQGSAPIKPIKQLLKEAIAKSNPCLLTELKTVCQKTTEDKTLEDCILILRYMEEFASFRENRRGLDDQEYIILALSLKLREYSPWEPLCRIGDAPNEIYYVLSGKVAVTSANAVVYTEEALEGKIFHNEGPGATLGEASILYNSNRTASLIAASNTSILFMMKEPYMRTIGDLVRKAHLYRIEMIQKQDIFSKWTMAQLASLYRNFEKKELAYGVHIYKAGDLNDKIYVILKGEVEILAKPVLQPIKQGLFINRNVEKRRDLVIKKIGDSCYFGNEEGFDPEEKLYTARVSSYTCTLILITKKKIRQNANYEPALMDHILNRSNKKKVFFENEKVKTFDKNTVIFGKSPQVDQQANKMQVNLFTLAGHHERTVSNTQETSLFFEAQSGGSSPKLKIKNYAENLLKAAEMYKDPGSVDSTVYDSPNKKKQKDTSKLDKSVAETKLGLVPVLSEPSVVSEILPNNRELLHGSQQPSLIESIQKIQKEHHHKLTQKTRNHDMSGRYAQSNRHNASSNGGSRENTFDEQAGDLESAENHPIYEAIRIEEEETRNKLQRKLGPRTKLLDHVNQVLIQSMFTEKQQIRMQKKNKTYKPEIQRKSQISEISWGDPLPPAVSFHVGSSLNNYSSTIVKDIKKLVQSTDMSAIQNSVQSGPEHLESEISSVTAQLRNLQKSSDLMKVLDLSKVDGGGFDKDIRKVPNYPKLYARDQRVSIMPKKETSTFQSGAELLQQINPSHPKFDLSSKRDNQPHKYQVVGNRSQPTLPQWVSEENSGSLAERGSSMIVGEIVGLSAIYSQTRNPLEPEKPREFRRGKTHSTVPIQSLETHGKISDHLSFIERASQAPFSDRTRSFAKPTSDYPARHPVLEFREGQSFKKLPVQNKEPSTERGKRSSPSMIGNIMRIPGMNPNPAERKSSPSKSDKSLDGQPPFPSPKKKGYKISSSSKGYSSHRKLLHRPTFKHAEEFTRIHPPLQLGPDTMVSAHGILDGPVQQSLQLRFNKAAKAQQMQPIKVTELLPRMKQMLRDSVELLASKPQQLIL